MTNEPNNFTPDDLEIKVGTSDGERPAGHEIRSHAKSGHSAKEKKPLTGKQKVRRVIIVILCVLLAIILAVASTYFVLYKIGEKKLMNYDVDVTPPELDFLDSVDEDGSTVVYKGETYEYNKNAVNIVFLGVDKKKYDHTQGYGRNGQADTILLMNLDVKTGGINILPISRETMTEIQMLTTSGKFYGTETRQICMAYAYGKDGKESCENICSSIRSLLFNVHIDSYISINMEGVQTLADAIGGVRLTPIESMIKSSGTNIIKGQEITLKGRLVDRYIRYRDHDVEANDRRMERQKQFTRAFASQAGNQVLKKPSRLTTLYNTAKPYIVGNLSLDEITYLSTKCLTANVGRSIVYHSVSGEHKVGEFAEFYPDKDSLWEAVLATCYVKASGK